ncbi:MAG: NlpC/P60 family protein [Pseudomonadota bacterium]
MVETIDAPAYDPRVTPARGDIAALDLRGTVEADAYVSGEPMVAAVAAAPITAAPHGEAEMTSQLLFGEPFTAYEVEKGWAWGQCGLDGYVGYVPAHDLMSKPKRKPTHRVSALQAIIYPTPDLKARPIGAVPFGSWVIVKAEEGAFAALDPGGFAPLASLKPTDEPELLWVAAAERLKGAPYLWGGRSSAGLDCSGLVQAALHAAGVECPRDSDQQMATLGRKVASKTLKRGDLVFWKGHVGIMTSSVMLLHANAHHMAVTEEPFETARARIAEVEFGEVLEARRLTP